MFFTLLKHPWLILPSVKATLRCSAAAEAHFADSHYGEGEANAYKHVLWNIFLADFSRFWLKTPEKRIFWAKKITDLHEQCFPNLPASQKMDLENNELGRKIYLKHYKDVKKSKDWEFIALKYKNEFSRLT